MDKLNNVEALINDPSFREWINSSAAENLGEWESIAIAHNVEISDIEKARLILLSLEQPKAEFRKDDESVLWERINSSIEELDSEKKIFDISRPNSNTTPVLDRKMRWWYGVAATLVFMVSFYLVMDYFTEPVIQTETPVTKVVKRVAKGQKLRLYLPDGSKVALNSLSQISYPASFNEGKREVEIEGEVYFEVKKDSLRPFIVKSRYATTEVLGTTFNVNTYSESEGAVISLLEGKVKVQLNQDAETTEMQSPIFLEPGEQISWNENKGSFLKEKIQNFNELKWMDGVLAFNNEPIGKVFKKLEMWYGVDFIFNKSLPEEEILTGNFQNAYLDNVLTSINYSINFDYEIEGDTIYVKF